MAPLLATVLELLTWLGVGRVSCAYGCDFGAVVAGAFKAAHKARCACLVLHFRRLDVDEKEYKARVKADPMYETTAWMGPWLYFYNMMEKVEKDRAKNAKGLGKLTLLFPCVNGGRPDPKKKGMTAAQGQKMAEALKTELVDCWKMPVDQLARHLMKAAGA